MGRKRKAPGKKFVLIGVKLHPDLHRQIALIAAKTDATLSQTARGLIEKGIAFEQTIFDENFRKLFLPRLTNNNG